MTREEAIEVLNGEGCYNCTWGCENPFKCYNEDCELPKAYEVAQKALWDADKYRKKAKRWKRKYLDLVKAYERRGL